MPVIRELVSGWFAAGRRRFRERSRSAVAWMVRLTVAAVAAFAVANLVFPRSDPLLAPLTALLIVQLTPVSILTSGVQRVVSVVAGVSVAVGFSSLVGLTWWSLGTVIAVSLLIGQMLRLGSNLLEVPISAMLVLGVGSRTAETAAWQRIAETLVGAGVGVVSNLLFPPKVATRDAAVAIEELAENVARILDSAAAEMLSQRVSIDELAESAAGWLGQARAITHEIPNAGAALLRAEESRRFNLRALGTEDSGPALRQGLEALEHSAMAIRSMFRSFLDAIHAYQSQGRDLGEDVPATVALLMEDLANALRAFGWLVDAYVHSDGHPPELTQAREALEGLRDARVRVTDLLLIEPRDDPALAVLNSSLLTTVERLLHELSLDEQIRRHARGPSDQHRSLLSLPRGDETRWPKDSPPGWLTKRSHD